MASILLKSSSATSTPLYTYSGTEDIHPQIAHCAKKSVQRDFQFDILKYSKLLGNSVENERWGGRSPTESGMLLDSKYFTPLFDI